MLGASDAASGLYNLAQRLGIPAGLGMRPRDPDGADPKAAPSLEAHRGQPGRVGRGNDRVDLAGGAGANVSHQTLPVGHQLSRADVALVRDWLAMVDVQEPLATR